jgi:hypothetical protein
MSGNPTLWQTETDWSVAIFVAACLLTVPHVWISVYSTGRRASKALGDLVHEYLTKMEKETRVKKSKVVIKNTEELFSPKNRQKIQVWLWFPKKLLAF